MRTIAGVVVTAVCTHATVAAAQVLGWPAESWSSATNLTPVEGPSTNDFHEDLSGAFWNPVTRRLWLCRNGPSNSTSKVWRLKEDVAATGGWVVDVAPGRCEWTGFNDAEAITQADLNSNIVYIMAEGEDVIRAYNLVTPGVVSLIRTYAVSAHLPTSGGNGAEGLAFVPDAHLRAAGFVNSAGVPTLSQKGLGGLFFVGHQNGGRVYVFDLSAMDTTFIYVGSFLTGGTETAEVTFDRSTGLLYVLHGDGVNQIEVCSLASTVQGSERRLVNIEIYGRPTGSATNANIEGFALFDNADRVNGRRSAFLTIDDGGPTSLLWFKQFPAVCRADWGVPPGATIDDIFAYLNDWFAGADRADFDFSGTITIDDIFGFLNAWFAGC